MDLIIKGVLTYISVSNHLNGTLILMPVLLENLTVNDHILGRIFKKEKCPHHIAHRIVLKILHGELES